jgi:hypothetical protein
MKYFVLEDNERRGTIVRSEKGKSFKYDKGRGWVRTGIMSQYHFPDSPLYESYLEILENEANNLIANM